MASSPVLDYTQYHKEKKEKGAGGGAGGGSRVEGEKEGEFHAVFSLMQHLFSIMFKCLGNIGVTFVRAKHMDTVGLLEDGV